MGKGEDLLEAIKQQDVSAVNKLVHKHKSKLLGSSKKVHVNYQDGSGFSPLHQAALCGNPELVCLLLEAKADVDIKDAKGMRPLHYAAWQGKLEPVSALLGANARSNATANDGCTPLHLSAQYGHYGVSELLLQYGGDPGLRNKNGRTALDLTCEFGRLNVTELFLNSNGCAALLEPSATDSQHADSITPLHLAASNGHKDIIRALLQTGIDINWTTKAGSCLHEAVAHGKPEVVRLLIDCGINVAKKNVLSQTALDLISKTKEMTPEINSIRQMLNDAQPGSMKVRAINDFKNVYDATSLAFKSGMLITVLEKNPNGNWKGKLRDPTTGQFRVGYFPAAYVEPQQNRHNSSVADGSDDSGIHPYDDDSQSSSSSPNSQYPNSGVTGMNLYNPVHHRNDAVPPNPGPRSPITMDSNHNLAIPHKYINTEPRNHRHSPQIPLANPNVINPSYEDVIPSKHDTGRDSGSHEKPITFSKSTQDMSLQHPHLNNPGYEDVLMQTSMGQHNHQMMPQSPHMNSTASMSYSQYSTASYHSNTLHPSSLSHPVGNGFYAAAQNFPFHAHEQRTSHLQHSHTFHEHNNNNTRFHHKMQGPQKIRHYSTGSKQNMEVSLKPPGGYDMSLESDKVHTWLSSMGLQQYTASFVSHGYDMPTICRMNPADLTAVGVSKPVHRKKISNQISKLSVPTDTLNHLPESVEEWCRHIGLPHYASIFYHNGINTIEKVMMTTWEDLQEMNIEKLGHQKKLLLGIARLKQILRNAENNPSAGTPKSPDGRGTDWPRVPHRENSSSTSSGHRISPATTPMSPYGHGIPPKQDTVRLPPLNSNTAMNQKMANVAAAAAARQADPRPLHEKIPERPKRLLPMSSFQENNELSDELQKALNKRQNIINNAPKEVTEQRSQGQSSPPNELIVRPAVSFQQNKPMNSSLQATQDFKLKLKPVQTGLSKPENIVEKDENSPPPWAADVIKYSNKPNTTTAKNYDSNQNNDSTNPNNQPLKAKNISSSAQRKPSMKGPKPSPPRRTCSLSENTTETKKEIKEPIKLEEPIDEGVVDFDPPVDQTSVGLTVRNIAAMMEPHEYSTPVPRVGQRSRSSSTKTPTSPLSPSAGEETGFVFPKPSDFKQTLNNPPMQTENNPHQHQASQSVMSNTNFHIPNPSKPKPPVKPALQTKPVNLRAGQKPLLNKKPVPNVPPQTNKPTPQTKKPSFDLSVLDKVEKLRQEKKEKLASKSSSEKDSDSNSQSSDEFDWPAPPPPSAIETPPISTSSTNNFPETTPKQYNSYTHTTQNTTRNNTVTPPTEIRTCFEEDEDTGTVKRRPTNLSRSQPPVNKHSMNLSHNTQLPSNNVKSNVTSKNPPPLPPKDPQPNESPVKSLSPTSKAAADKRMSELENILQEINTEISICSTKTVPSNTPPKVTQSIGPALPPKVLSVKRKSLEMALNPPKPVEKLVVEEVEEDISGLSSKEKENAQKMLDDIGSMFDDLALEFDELLS